MTENSSKLWQSYHTSERNRMGLSGQIKSAWRKSDTDKVDFVNAKPSSISRTHFDTYKNKTRFLYVSANNVITKMAEQYSNLNIGYALFSSDKYLLKLYGSASFLRWCEEHSITSKTIWDEKVIGANAVCIGMELKQPLSTVGAENYSKFLSNIAIHFCPIAINNTFVANSYYGGLALFCPEDINSLYLPILCYASTREISLMSFWHNSTRSIANVDGAGLITIDQSANKNHILFVNDQLYKALNMPRQNLAFIELEEIIAPLPANNEFWDIVNNRRVVEDISVRLKSKWGTISLMMSTTAIIEPTFHMIGISMMFQTARRIKNIISKYTSSNANFTFDDIITKNKQFYDVLQCAKAAADSEISLLILGESGSGKDVIAQAVHNASSRRDKPFIALNCAAFSKELISSELFGYESGSFTGAVKGGTIGKFELANNGTLFLDEIGDMPLDLQATLLRVLETQSFMKVGGNEMHHVNVRIITATNQNLMVKIQQKLFREDLFYRLGILRLNIPPLRDRKEDIIPLAEFFIDMICKRIHKKTFVLTPKAKEYLEDYTWPGNVRELKNMLEGIINIYDGPYVESTQISNYLFSSVNNNLTHPPQPKAKAAPKAEASIAVSKEDIMLALKKQKGNKVETAKALGISRRTLYRRLTEFELL